MHLKRFGTGSDCRNQQPRLQLGGNEVCPGGSNTQRSAQSISQASERVLGLAATDLLEGRARCWRWQHLEAGASDRQCDGAEASFTSCAR